MGGPSRHGARSLGDVRQAPSGASPSGTVGAGPYRINVAAELSGVPAATLRAWERRYGIPVPRRTASAYRLYTAEDVDQVRRMRELVAEGVSPAEAARVLRTSPPPLLEPEEAPSPDGVDAARARLLAAAQRFDAATLDAEIARLSMLLDAQSFYERVVGPLILEVGRRWEAGELSVGQEHLLSERLEYAMRATLRTLERPDGPLVLMACIEGEQHVLGMLGAAIRFAGNGARVVVLGAATPPAAVADAVRTMTPRLVGLSACAVPANARELVVAYADACGSTPWVLGGPAAPAIEELVAEAGGIVATGRAPRWQTSVREWLRWIPRASTTTRITRRGDR